MSLVLAPDQFCNYDVSFTPDAIFESLNIASLENLPVSAPAFPQIKEIVSTLQDAMKNNEIIYVYGDYDTDGLMCAMQWIRFFEQLEYDNVVVYKYRLRTHAIEASAITEAIGIGASVVIICDTGSSVEDRTNLERLVKEGIKPIVLDHHEIDGYDEYPEGITVINSFVERESGFITFPCSGGSLTYIVVSQILDKVYDKAAFQQVFCALISLYADSVPMNYDYNRHIYYTCMSLNETMAPGYIKAFFTPYTVFKRRFIEWTLNPKINALFRSESFDILNALFLDSGSIMNKVDLVNECIKVHRDSANFVDIMLQHLIPYVVEKKNFVVCDMSRARHLINNTAYVNYSGLLANKLASMYGKIAVTYGEEGTSLKGSVRDIMSRDMYSYFSVFSNAGGHKSAFGLHMETIELTEFINNLDILDQHVLDLGEVPEPIIFNADVGVGSSDLECIALYNEFAGGQYLPCFIQKKISAGIRGNKTKYNYRYSWDAYTIISQEQLKHGALVLLKPISDRGVSLRVN